MSQNKNIESHLEDLGVFVHGSLFALHSLGFYNAIRKKQYLHAFIHGAVASYDLVSVFYHHNKLKEVNKKS